MLESFEISNFRLFQHLKVKKLNRVNLIVGKINSGKSSFLEALEIYASNASASVLFELLESRQEDWFSDASPQSGDYTDSPFRHLFFGHKLPESNEQGIAIRASSIKLCIDVAAYQLVNDDKERITTRHRVNDLKITEDLSNLEIYLIVEDFDKVRRICQLGYNLKDIKRRTFRLFDLQKSDFKYTWQFVSTKNMSNKKLSALWDLTSLNNELKSEVIEALCLIDQRVTGVGFVDDTSNGRDRIPLVTMSRVEEPLPLKSMGDGMTRLFHIILALVNAKNGLLLIDEFENGLHWSVQPKIWNIIFQLAERLNVQVFATTHSRDCIAGFDDAWNNYPELGAFLRQDLKDGIVKATEYSSETLTDAIEMDVEVR